MEIILREVGAGGGYEGSRPAERDGPLGPGVTLQDRAQPFTHLPLFYPRLPFTLLERRKK